MSPTVWALTICLAAIFSCVMPWQQTRGARGSGSTRQGASHTIGLIGLITCAAASSVLSVVVLWKPQPKWVAYPPVVAGSLVLLLGLVYAFTAVDRSAGSFSVKGGSAAISSSLAYGYYLHMLLGAGMIAVGVYQLMGNKRPAPAKTAATAKPGTPTSAAKRR